jgi:large subunit ribosomal protein L29
MAKVEKKEKTKAKEKPAAPGKSASAGKQAQALSRWRSMKEEELLTEARGFRQELFNLRLRQQTGSVEKPSRMRDLRKDIARIETILRAKRA